MKTKAIAGVLILCIPVGALLGLFLWFSRDLPSTDALVSVRPWTRTVLYDIHGKPIKAFYEEDRVIVPLDEIPQHLTNAFIATEDRKFYRHWGLNVFAIAKAISEDVLARRIVRGASTITQQLARNLFLTQEQTLTRKIKEAILAIRIERHYTKEEILQMYLNQIYFGEGAYGVEAAARRFFSKHVSELGLAECSLLAGLPRNPGAYNPKRHMDRAKQRQAIVLASMTEMGMVGAEEAARAKNDTIRVVPQEKAEVGAYFAEYIRRILEDTYGVAALYREGLRVYTTLDLGLQETAESVLEGNLRAMEKRLGFEARDTTGTTRSEDTAKTEYIQGSLIAIDPTTGHIKAMVGGRDFLDSQWNRATQAPRQPGSAFKMFVYTAAIDNGMTPADLIMDAPIVVDMPDSTQWRPSNFTETFRGPVRLRTALAKSINIPAIKVADRIGQTTVIHYARKMGIKSPLRPYMSIALGSFEVTLMEIVSGASVLATSGIRAEPMAITKIETRDGRTLERNLPRKSEAISAQTAFVMTSLMQSVTDIGGTAQAIRLRGIKRTFAGKTGTTNDYTDAWFIGFCPDLATGVWVGFDEKRTMGEKETGARVALPIWIEFMTEALRGIPDRPFPEPHGIVRREICEETGLLATSHCPARRTEIFISGTEPLRFCDIHSVREVSDVR
jgi:penicillin-binding protein 1A